MSRRSEPQPAPVAFVPQSEAVDLGHLPQLVGYSLKRAQHAVARNFNRRFGDLDIRPTQLGVLTVVARNPGLKQSDVGAALGIKRANLVPLLNTLEQRGLLARARAAGDRRSHALHLTGGGEAVLAEAMRREQTHEAEIAALMSETERNALVRLLDRVRQACDAVAAAEAPED